MKLKPHHVLGDEDHIESSDDPRSGLGALALWIVLSSAALLAMWRFYLAVTGAL